MGNNMNNKRIFLTKIAICSAIFLKSGVFYANPPQTGDLAHTPTMNANPLITPTAPTLNAKAYILIDVNSGKIIAEKNSEEKRGS